MYLQSLDVGGKTIAMLDEQGGESVISIHLIPDVYFNIPQFWRSFHTLNHFCRYLQMSFRVHLIIISHVMLRCDHMCHCLANFCIQNPVISEQSGFSCEGQNSHIHVNFLHWQNRKLLGLKVISVWAMFYASLYVNNGQLTGDDRTCILFLSISGKLRNVTQDMDQIEQDLKQARKNLNELSKWCGLCLWPSNRLVRAYILLIDNDF